MANFEVGSIITGKENNRYLITSSGALMVVIAVDDQHDTENNDIKVEVIASISNYHIGDTWWVKSERFEYTKFEEFYEKHPDVNKVSNQKLDRIRNNLGIEEFIVLGKEKVEKIKPKKVRSPITKKERGELLEEMRTLLLQYNYHPTDKGLNEIIDEWATNKAPLIKLFKKHPNYNGKFQIVFDHDFNRVIDKEQSYVFAEYLKQITRDNLLLKEYIVGKFSYSELIKITMKLRDIVYTFENSSYIRDINGKTYTEYNREFKRFSEILKNQYKMNKDVYIRDGKAYKREDVIKSNKISNVISVLTSSSHISQFVDKDIESYFARNIPEAKIKEGQKLSRAINKILHMLGVDKLPDYNAQFAKYADSINPLKIKRHTVLSIHPVDYYTMSFGNSWSSCHTIDKLNKRHSPNSYQGEYSAGTESYMLDGTSMVFYTVDSSYDGNELELQDKITRNMFHYYDNKLIQGRIYPQDCDSGCNDLYKDIREIVQKIIADMLKVPNLWVNKKGTAACGAATSSCGRHYKDYLSYENCNISILKDTNTHSQIKIGHNAICPSCGETHGRSNNIECGYCR